MEPTVTAAGTAKSSVHDCLSPVLGVLVMAMLSVRDLPPAQRLAWRQLFEHYVFAADEQSHEHIPMAARGGLRPLDPNAARVLRARLLKSLNR